MSFFISNTRRCVLASFILCLVGFFPLQAEVRGQVNRRTLNFFLPIDMLSLPCYMPIEIRGAYNSYSGESSIFGPKWTFNYNIRITPDRTRFKITEGDGFENSYTREKNLEEAKNNLVDQLLTAQKKSDSKSGGLKIASAYEEFKRRLMTDTAFREEQERKLLLAARPLGAGTYYSFSRGPSTLEMKSDGSFVRTFQNKSKDFFNRDGQLIRSADKFNNAITFTYQGKNLTRINDACNGSMSFTYKAEKTLEGLVASIRDSLSREIKFEFFPTRRLKSFQSAANEISEFTYDTIGNMLSLSTGKLPLAGANKVGGDEIELSYNPQYEVVKQTEPGSRETKYSRSFVANNQNHSITEITQYLKGKLAEREVQEVKLKEFEIVSKFDSKGTQLSRETKKLSPTTGYPISVLDDKGRGELVEYDADTGNPIRREIVPGGEVMEYVYDKTCNQVSTVKMKKMGRPPTEATFKYDAFCNPLSAKEMQGTKKTVDISIKWNDKGKIMFLTDELQKKEIAFTYWKFGKTESITLRDVGTLLVKYSPAGDIQRVDTFAHGKGKIRFKGIETLTANGVILQEVKGALDSILGTLKPSGINIGL